MIEPASMTGRRHVLIAILVVSVIAAGSAVVALATRNGGFRIAPAFAEGTILEVPGGSCEHDIDYGGQPRGGGSNVTDSDLREHRSRQ